MSEELPESAPEVKLRIKLPPSIGAQIDFVETSHTLLETISDVREALAAASQLNSVTNYSLVYNGTRITEQYDDLVVLSEALGDVEGTVDLQLAEKPYNLKAVHEHLIRFRENIGMNFFDHAARALSAAAGFLKLNSLGLKKIQVGEPKEEGTEEKDISVSEEDLESIKSVVLKILQERNEDSASDSVLAKWRLPLKALQISQWSPVPHQQAVKGDLLYLTLTTLESETYSITCHASGFFVSKLSNANFDPSLKVNEKGVFFKEYLLLKLIEKLSPKFAATMADNREALFSSTQFPESYLIPAQVSSRFSWAISEDELKISQVPDYSRSQAALFSNGVDSAELVRDWNDEFQGIKEFARDTFNERLLRDKLLNKYIQEFNQTAVHTAMEIVKGNVTPLNPNESRDNHIFLRNNIFYSFGVNATGAHDNTGGDEAARHCFSKDISSVKLLNRIDTGSICNLLSAVVDFMGERVVCQAPVPGVFNDLTDKDGNPVDKVAYGYSLDENKITVNEEYEAALKPVAEAFHLKEHGVKLSSGASSQRDLIVSKDVKGITGTDDRKYLIDLYRVTPLDIEFLEKHFDTGAEGSYPHREASLRHEAVEEWYKRSAAALFEVETERLESSGELSLEEKPQIAIPFDQITFNPDAFTGVEELDEDKQTVRQMSQLVTKHLIPEFLEDISKNAAPFDGTQLCDYMHKSGINIRYLGAIAESSLESIAKFESEVELRVFEAEKESLSEEKQEEKASSEELTEEVPADENLQKEEPKQEPSAASMTPVVSNMNALHRIAVQEMIARGSKHALRLLGQKVPTLLKAPFVSHFINCLLGAKVNSAPKVEFGELSESLFSDEELLFTKLTPETVQDFVTNQVQLRYRYTLPSDWVLTIKPLQMLREISYKYGVQWKAQVYHFNQEEFAKATAAKTESVEQEVVKTKKGKKVVRLQSPASFVRTTVFVPEDIVAFVPLVKDSSYRCSFVDEVFESARIQIKNGETQLGLDLLTELVTFYQQIYGNVHQETSAFYFSSAQIYSDCGLHSEASIVSRKATLLYERLTGVDSYETINSYIKASFYESLNKDHDSAFKLNAKAFEEWSRVYGPDHPNSVNTFSNFASVLHEIGLDSEARNFFTKALDLSILLNGELSDITAIIRHRLAILYVQVKEYKLGLEQFEKAAETLGKLVGPNDTLTKECVSFAANLKKYISVTEQQLSSKKKSAVTAGKSRQVKTAPQSTKKTKGKKKEHVPLSDIGTKSVEEIMQFIDGQLGKKGKN